MNVHLSPHVDDVCFSIGRLASRLGGDLVNLFTLSGWVAVDMDLPADNGERIAAVTQLRRQEDQRFVLASGLVRHDLGLRESPFEARGNFDLTQLDVDLAALSASLAPYLLALLPGDSDPDTASLYCPLGVGYASGPRAREAGLQRAGQVFAGSRLSPIVETLQAQDAERKMRWIGLYASQHPRMPRDADFTPASEMAPGLHEIVWRVSPLVGDQA